MNNKYLKTFLTCFSSVGVILTSVVSIMDTLKHTDEDMTIKEYVEKYYKDYIPTMAVSTFTVASIISNHVITNKEIKSLALAVAGTTALLSDYKNEIKDQLNEEQFNDIIRGVGKRREDGIQKAKQVYITRMGLINADDFETEPGDHLFYDEFTDTWFRSSKCAVTQAMYHFNRNFALSGEIPIDDFYEFLGIEPSMKWPDRLYGFGNNILEDGIFWIDFEMVDSVSESGEEYTIIYFTFQPGEYDLDECTYV